MGGHDLAEEAVFQKTNRFISEKRRAEKTSSEGVELLGFHLWLAVGHKKTLGRRIEETSTCLEKRRYTLKY